MNKEKERKHPICCDICGEYKTDKDVQLYEMINDLIQKMDHLTKEQLEGAIYVLFYISGYMKELHFDKKKVYSRKALVTALSEINENLLIRFKHFNKVMEYEKREKPGEGNALINEYESN